MVPVGRGDTGAGSALAVGIVAALLAFCILVLPLTAALAARHRATAAADASALAGADVALGAAPGVPCERAAAVATANGARLTACRQRGTTVRVRVVLEIAGLPLGADARAGPPPAGSP